MCHKVWPLRRNSGWVQLSVLYGKAVQLDDCWDTSWTLKRCTTWCLSSSLKHFYIHTKYSYFFNSHMTILSTLNGSVWETELSRRKTSTVRLMCLVYHQSQIFSLESRCKCSEAKITALFFCLYCYMVCLARHIWKHPIFSIYLLVLESCRSGIMVSL